MSTRRGMLLPKPKTQSQPGDGKPLQSRQTLKGELIGFGLQCIIMEMLGGKLHGSWGCCVELLAAAANANPKPLDPETTCWESISRGYRC